MKTVDISGFGGAYEAACQKMLIQGMKYLKEHPDFDFKVYRQYKNVTGLCIGEGEAAAALDKVICEGVEPTGAMHQFVVNHLSHIHRHGYEAWLKEAEEHGMTIYERQSEEELDRLIKKE